MFEENRASKHSRFEDNQQLSDCFRVCVCVCVCLSARIHFCPLPANYSIDTLIYWITVGRVIVFYKSRPYHQSIDGAVFAFEATDVYELEL